jgi:DNA recombination protein RmuC
MDSVILIAVAVAALVVLAAVLWMARRDRMESQSAIRDISQAQAELAGRLQQMGETQAAAQARISDTLQTRLDAMGDRLGQGLHQHTEKTGQAMNQLHERLAVIDSAQKNLTTLSEQMVSLQDILSNKQSRGAFGETQLNDIVKDMLPPSAYAFQATLSNGKRADCLIKLPNPPGSIVVDSKFPLESYQALRNAETDGEKTQAARAFSADVIKHVKDIQERYIVSGETADSALMFLPSEAVYAELHAQHRNVVEESHRRRVWIVSPTTLMALLNTIRAVLKDARMREQADVIQDEVHKLLADVGRIDERVGKLQSHFNQAQDDVRKIRISTDKVTKRGERIQDIELGAESPTDELDMATLPRDKAPETEED